MNETDNSAQSAMRRGPTVTPLGWTFGLFTSVWFGITLMVILFLYCSVGSAVPGVRQHRLLEMTEYEWFNWWPFNTLVLLLCINLTVVTVRQIPLRLVNLGVWSIHTGIVMLALGSWYYFSTKVEGDAPVFRRHVTIDLPGAEPSTLLALPGNRTDVAVGPDIWQFAIQDTNSAWQIASDEHEGETAYAVSVLVQPPSGERFVRQLLAGYPQYTEDVIPGKGRAVKAIGTMLVDETLKISLEYEPQRYFHLQDTWALFVRRLGASEWSQRPIDGLPRYHDRVASRDQVFFAGADERRRFTVRPIDLSITPPPDGDVLVDADVRITGFLRYAHMRRRWREGTATDPVNPMLTVSLFSAGSSVRTDELFAFDGARRQTEDGLVRFMWADSADALDTLSTSARANLHFEVPNAGVVFDVQDPAVGAVGHDGPFTPIEGTDLSYRVVNVHDGLVVPGRNTPISVAIVDVQTPEGTFTRMVADQANLTKDMHGDRPDPHAPGDNATKDVDPRIAITYQPQSAPITLIAIENGRLHLVVNSDDGLIKNEPITLGSVVDLIPTISLRVDGLLTRATDDVLPFVVPESRRQRRNDMAMIRLDVAMGGDVQIKWLPYNHYALPSREYGYRGRLPYSPVTFQLPDGGWAEVMFSRVRRELPNPIALDDFDLLTHVGGYSGNVLAIQNYVSRLRFLEGGEWSAVSQCSVNAPTESGGLWYYQNTWDKPSNSNPNGGMNFTGVGVGNRNGVYIQLAGCCISVAGMLFAFYLKPVIRRRRRMAARAKITGATIDAEPDGSEPSAVETVEPVGAHLG